MWTQQNDMNIHINITQGDYIFAEWEDEDWKEFSKQVHELRKQGYRKINANNDYQNYYEFYRKKGKKKVVTVTMMCM